MTDTGGIEVTCPCCLGEGEIKSLEHALEEVQQKNSDDEPKKEKRKYEKKSSSSFPIHPDQKSLNLENGEIE